MKKLVLSALLAATASQAAGCIIVDDDNTGAVSVSWTPVTADANGNPVRVNYPAGATTAILYAQRDVDARPFEDVFFTADGRGVASDLPEGEYSVWVRFTDDAKVARFAESGSQRVVVDGGGTSAIPNYDIFVDHAFYLASWNLHPGSANAAPVACGTIAGEAGVSISATDSGGMLWDVLVDCEEGLAPLQTTTRPLPSVLNGNKSYLVHLSLVNAAKQSIGDAPDIIPSQAGPLDYGNKLQPLPVGEIVVR